MSKAWCYSYLNKCFLFKIILLHEQHSRFGDFIVILESLNTSWMCTVYFKIIDDLAIVNATSF